MTTNQLSRRDFLRYSALTAAGIAVVACQPKETPAEATATAEPTKAEEQPTSTAAPAQPTPTSEPTSAYQEAPALASMVQSGDLPAIEERLPANPLVEAPAELWGWKGDIGQYGGTWRMVTRGPGDGALWMRVVNSPKLVMWAPDFANPEVVPATAEGWDISADGRAFTFHVRKNVKWWDGEPFGTSDLQYYWDTDLLNETLNPAPWSVLRQGEDLAELSVQDDFTFTITFKNPNGFFVWDMAQPGAATLLRPAHFMQQFHVDFVDKAEMDKMIKDGGFDTWDQVYAQENDNYNLVGLRPTMFPWKITVPMGEATAVVYERNPYFWMLDPEGQQLPYIDRLRGAVHQTAETMALAAVAGEVDMQTRHISTVDYIPMLQEGQQKGDYWMVEFCANEGPSRKPLPFSRTYMGDETKHELFDNKDFRLAMSHAIDRENLHMVLWRGAVAFEGPKWDSPLQQDAEDELWAEYARYDLDWANQKFDELGLDKRDSDGYRLMKDGKRLTVILETVTMWKDAVQMLELVVEDWKKVGVEGILKTWDRPLFQEKRDENECELCVHSGPGRGADYTVSLMVDARYEAPVHWEADYGHEWYEWYNSNEAQGQEPPDDVKQALDLYDEVKSTPDFEKQVELFKQIIMIRTEGFWWINLGPYWVDSCTLGVAKNDMQNVPPKMPNNWPWATPGPSKTWMYYYDPPRES